MQIETEWFNLCYSKAILYNKDFKTLFFIGWTIGNNNLKIKTIIDILGFMLIYIYLYDYGTFIIL